MNSQPNAYLIIDHIDYAVGSAAHGRMLRELRREARAATGRTAPKRRHLLRHLAARTPGA